MGLPLFITPPEPEVAANTSERSAARSRSSIRRRHVARVISRRRLEDREPGVRVPVVPLPPATSDPQIFSDVLSPAEVREVDIEGIRARIASRRQVIGELPRNSNATVAGSQTQDGVVVPAFTSSDTPRMPPVPETEDFRVSARLVRSIRRQRGEELSSELRRNPRLNVIESGTHQTPLREHFPDTNDSPTSQLPPLSHDFSPARQFMSNEIGPRSSLDRSSGPPEHTWPFAFTRPSRPDVPQTSADGISSRDLSYPRGLPPLRRMGRRSISDLETRLETRRRLGRFDGLGDRDRSLSPDGDGAWETILTTLAPDPQLPSAGSSFASTSAGASTSSNAGSSGTSLTTIGSTPDPIDMDHPIENVCDVADECSDLSDTEVEDEDDVYELHGGGLAENDRFWCSYTDVVVARADRVARHSGATDADNLGGMQRIVARLARREDIPDEWWAGAGLSRILPRETAG